jgi:hypothetical protein
MITAPKTRGRPRIHADDAARFRDRSRRIAESGLVRLQVTIPASKADAIREIAENMRRKARA